LDGENDEDPKQSDFRHDEAPATTELDSTTFEFHQDRSWVDLHRSGDVQACPQMSEKLAPGATSCPFERATMIVLCRYAAMIVISKE
jgi:hypothetical protein